MRELNWFQKLLLRLASRIVYKYGTVNLELNNNVTVNGFPYIVTSVHQSYDSISIDATNAEEYRKSVDMRTHTF